MKWWMRRIIGGLALFSVMVGVLSFVTMWLWNFVVPEVFKGPSVTFAQALAILLLSHILLRGSTPFRHGGGWHRERWRRHFERKLETMTPEEREKFRSEWGRRCGWESPSTPDAKTGVGTA